MLLRQRGLWLIIEAGDVTFNKIYKLHFRNACIMRGSYHQSLLKLIMSSSHTHRDTQQHNRSPPTLLLQNMVVFRLHTVEEYFKIIFAPARIFMSKLKMYKCSQRKQLMSRKAVTV